ncbi:MAG TPA: pyridoxal phosphate-dependent aminotransferase, partial [Xanthomonadales bacterium]|nr:pyridoxal phosphate-dependent aminotransferase [Xanthomonadales bacterium]
MSHRKLKGAEIAPFYADIIGKLGSARRRAGLPLIPMHFGQPSSGAPAAAITAAHQVLDSDPLGYIQSAALIERLSRHYDETYGVNVAPGRILLTAGASAGLVAAFAALFDADDRIALVCPGYPAYRNVLHALGLTAVEMHCERAESYRPSLAKLAALDPAPTGFVLASPANPTGAMLDAAALEAMVNYCRDQNITLISDEIYHGITYGQPAVSALQFDDRAIVINSFSKLYRMPGWRLGWMVVPEDYADQISAYVINMFLTPSTLAQHAALVAMDETDDLQAGVETYRQNRQRLIAGLAALGITETAPPDGAFYVYADLGHITNDSLAFCIRAVEEIGVGLAPGIDFDPQHGHRFVRFSFAVSPAEIEAALELLQAWLPGYR